jgi:flagellar motor protein MotB
MSVNEQDRAYKRGVVLGLTLAEVVILVIFCLLLALVLPWKLGAKPADEADRIRDTFVAQLEEMRGATPPEIFWRLVVDAYRRQRRESAAEAPRERPPGTSTSREVVERVVAEMESARGAATLDEYWRRLRWASAQEAELRAALEREIAGRKAAEKRAADCETTAKAEAARCEKLEQEKGEAAVAKLRREKEALEEKLAEAEARLSQAEAERRSCGGALTRCETAAAGAGRHDWPPIINLKEAAGYSFRTADAGLSRDFEARLSRDVVPKILDNIRQFGVDVIEVVGHTDERPMQGAGSNLDTALLPLLNNPRAPLALVAIDNTGLGMARAAAVVRFLRADPRLAAYRDRILPLSSGQVLDPTGRLAAGGRQADQPERRRIEIRLRRDVR